MSMDVIGNFLTVIRNGLAARKRVVKVPFSNEKLNIAKVLKEEGYIKEYQKTEEGMPSLEIHLKYVAGEPAVHEIKRVSRPGRRHYESLRNMQTVTGGLGISILSTNKGIMTDRKARELSVGGEVLCHVW